MLVLFDVYGIVLGTGLQNKWPTTLILSFLGIIGISERKKDKVKEYVLKIPFVSAHHLCSLRGIEKR